MRTRTGLENLTDTDTFSLKGQRLGLLANPASINSRLSHASREIHRRYPGQLTALFSPQHGVHAEKQDNMIESSHTLDPELMIPVFSLYGETRIPTKDMLEPLDTLIVDLQDVGTRVYTFIYTLSHCMEAAKRLGKKVVVLDRPNPLGGAAEGNILATSLTSFVGRFPIPMRHGLTIGELARLFNDRFGIACDLQVVPMTGWNRNACFGDTGLPWVQPSPNLPTPASAAVYPGQVLWEGTNVSEGRGTTQPFEFFGAPFVSQEKMLKRFPAGSLPGVFLRPVTFQPTSGKWADTPCRGFQIHITDPKTYKPYITSLKLLQAVTQTSGPGFEWKKPPYEYEYEKLPIDLIVGDTEIRRALETGTSLDATEKSMETQAEEFLNMSRKHWLYK